ncbi:MAG: hypothetical protein R3Y27_02310, partial [Clostridia bacterium]
SPENFIKPTGDHRSPLQFAVSLVKSNIKPNIKQNITTKHNIKTKQKQKPKGTNYYVTVSKTKKI